MKISVFLWIHFIQCTCKWKSPIGIKTRHMYATSCIKFLKYIIKVLLNENHIRSNIVTKLTVSCHIFQNLTFWFSTVSCHILVYHCKLSQVVTFWFTTVSIHKLSHFTVFQNPKNSPKNQKNDFHILGYLTHFHDLYILPM